MHPAVYIPTSVPLQFLRTYNLETRGKGKGGKRKKRITAAVLGLSTSSATKEELFQAVSSLGDLQGFPEALNTSITCEQDGKAEMSQIR